MPIERPASLPLQCQQLADALNDLPAPDGLGISRGLGCTLTIRKSKSGDGQVIEVDLDSRYWDLDGSLVVISISDESLADYHAVLNLAHEYRGSAIFQAAVPTTKPFTWRAVGVLLESIPDKPNRHLCPPVFRFHPLEEV